MFNVGILGTGNIAGVMTKAIKDLKGVTVAAVASRDLKRAKEFVKQNCPKAKALGSYEELARMDGIDLVYIATPHSYHYENAITCIKEYKNVLVEKPFAMSRAEADSIFTEAKNRGVFVCEAMWTAFMPLHKQMLKWIGEGRIGAVRYISSNLGYNIENRKRMTDPALGGGAYLDLGVYTTHLAVCVLGESIEPKSVYSRMLSNGVDRDVTYILGPQGDGPISSSYVTMSARTDKDGAIVGEKGYIKFFDVNNYERIELHDEEGALVEACDREGLIGYALEVKASKEAIENGLIQCAEMPWHRTAAICSLNDRIRSMM